MDAKPLPRVLDAEPYLLRLPEPGDCDAVVAVCQDPEISRWTMVPSPYGPEEFAAYLALSAAGWEERSSLNLLVFDRAGELLASVGAATDWAVSQAQLGYYAAAAARGRGVVTAAAGAVCDWLFAAGFARVEARVIEGNVASGRLLERLGFELDQTRRDVDADGCGDGVDVIDMQVWGRSAP